MKKKFFTNLIFLVTVNLLVKPFWVFGIDRVVQNRVGTADYGLYFSLFNASILFNILLDFGLTNFNNKNISQYRHLLPKYFSNIVVLKLLMAILYAVVTIIAGLIARYSWAEFQLLFLLIINQFLLSFILYLRSNISAFHKFKTDSIISVTDRFLMILIIGALLWTNISGGKIKISWFILAQTVSYLITALIAFVIVLHKAKKLVFKINIVLLKLILKQTFPFALLVLFMSFYNRFDGVLLKSLLNGGGDIQAGIYAQSFRLLDALSQFALLFSTLLLPIFSRMIVKKEDVSELVSFSFFLLLTPAVILVVASVFYNHEIISLLYKEHNDFSAKVFAILIISFIPISATYIFGTLLTANGSLKHLNIIAFAGVVISLSLNFILIPLMKAKGAAITALIVQSVTAIAQIVVGMNVFKIKIETKKIINIFLFLALFLLSSFALKSLNINWLMEYLLIIAVGIILSFIFKLISLKLMFRILKGYEE